MESNLITSDDFTLDLNSIKKEYRDVNLKSPKLFDEFGSDKYSDQMIIGGRPSGIVNMNTVRHQWAVTMYNKMWSFHWQPQKVDMTGDSQTIKLLPKKELNAHLDTISFLAFMDSFQMNNLPNIFEYITSPMIKACGDVQTAFEGMHTQAYQFGIVATVQVNDRDSVYNRWKDNPLLKHRIKTMTDIAEKFKENPTLENFYIVLIMNYILEGFYFYQGFTYYDLQAHRGRIIGMSKQVDYIRRDELLHMGMFINMIKEIGIDHNLIKKMFKWAFHEEEKWNHAVYGDGVLGMSKQSCTQYCMYLCNDRLARLGIEPIFDKVDNPYQHLEDSTKEGGKRENFFETNVTSYDTAGSVDGWDDL